MLVDFPGLVSYRRAASLEERFLGRFRRCFSTRCNRRRQTGARACGSTGEDWRDRRGSLCGLKQWLHRVIQSPSRYSTGDACAMFSFFDESDVSARMTWGSYYVLSTPVYDDARKRAHSPLVAVRLFSAIAAGFFRRLGPALEVPELGPMRRGGRPGVAWALCSKRGRV